MLTEFGESFKENIQLKRSLILLYQKVMVGFSRIENR